VSTEELDQLRQDFPSWHVWLSQAGRFWAARLGRVAWDGHHDPDFAMTVDADTLPKLRAELTLQNDLFPERPVVTRPRSRP
jgi:hypothetical protein